MKAIQVDTKQEANPLVWRETTDPSYGPEEVLVDVYATALNRADLAQRAGNYPPPPGASDILYVKALAAPLTINTMPELTLKAFADHGELDQVIPADGGDCEGVLAELAGAGIDVDALGIRLQEEGAAAFVNSWNDLMAVLAAKTETLRKAG